MLAERTDEHLALFEEGKEAEFFSSDEELRDKVRYYLTHSEERHLMAAAGRERAIKGGYSNHERLRSVLAIVETIKSRKLGTVRK
jgi:spore maturation protein CgeB